MRDNAQYDVVIIGAGLAGIACAIRLRAKGKSVLVIEKNKKHGGKLDEVHWKGYRWDKGPSLFTEPELIEELFALCNKSTGDYFEYEELNASATYHFHDGSKLTLNKNKNQLKQDLTKFSSASEAHQVLDYIEESKEMYETVGDFFISNPKPGLRNVFDKQLVKRYPKFLKKQLRTTLHNFNTSKFGDQRLVQLFNRFGTYNGSNPYQMSGLYAMISYLEISKGTFAPKKGMRSIVDSLYILSKEIGVEYRFSEYATAKETKEGYLIKSTEHYATKALICAIDHIPFYEDVLQDSQCVKQYKRQERSSSGLVFYWAINKAISDLELHNMLFSKDYETENDTIWRKKQNPLDPSIYINVGSTENNQDAPDGCQNWFVMINTPANVVCDTNYRARMKQKVIDKVQLSFGIDIEPHIIHEDYWDCQGIEMDTGSYQGALYGSSSNSLGSALKRHPNRSKNHKRLYFCGGSVHPGGGIPLVLRSAKIVDSYFNE